MNLQEKLISDFIPRIEEMVEKEREHLNWLITNKAPKNLITISSKHLYHYIQRIGEYKEYVMKRYNEKTNRRAKE